MQVSVEAPGGLLRRVTVAVPEEQIAEVVDKRLKDLTRRVKLKGFRPGKVPFGVVQRQYGPQVREEVVGELVQSSFYQAVSQEQLRPAGNPYIDAKASEPGAGLEYTATFEVYPEIQLASLEGTKFQRPVVEITEADVDAMLESVRAQHKTWEAVQRPAQDGDRVTVDFSATIEGEPFKGNEGTNLPIVLGEGRMIAGFEDGLRGAAAGEVRTLDLEFPADYHAKEIAGRPVQFQVTVTAVEEPRLPEVDEALARKLGVADGSVEKLREEVRANMERELEQAVRSRVKQQVMDRLLELNPIEIPKALVEEEARRLAAQMMQNLASQGGRGMNLSPEMFTEQAQRRVALGLILAEVIRAEKLSVDAKRVREAVERMASAYEQPEEVVKWFYGDRQRLQEMESMVLEDQIVEHMQEKAEIEEVRSTFGEFMSSERKSEQS